MTVGLPRTVRVHAPAKVNPTLAVLGRRDDGYHEVDTTMVMLDVSDVVTLTLRSGAGPGRVRVHGPAATEDVPTDDSNLAVRALRLALEGLPPTRGVAIDLDLEKHVPSQAGLGGGSSDAAAVLRGVELLLGHRLGAAERVALLAGLGADCVFFDAAVETGAGRATGIGERLATGAAPAWHVAVVTPEAACPTGAIYGALELDADRQVEPSEASGRVLGLSAAAARGVLFNDLERAALRAVPELRAWRSLLDELGGKDARIAAFRLSGSGSSWFGLAENADEAGHLLEGVTEAAHRRGLAIRGAFATTVAAPAPPAEVGEG